jgi:hypothetical protein
MTTLKVEDYGSRSWATAGSIRGGLVVVEKSSYGGFRTKVVLWRKIYERHLRSGVSLREMRPTNNSSGRT